MCNVVRDVKWHRNFIEMYNYLLSAIMKLCESLAQSNLRGQGLCIYIYLYIGVLVCSASVSYI